MKILIWLVIALAVVVWFKRTMAALRSAGERGNAQGGNRGGAGGAGRVRRPEPQAETMLQCAYCGVHFPASEAAAGADGRVYCSSEHKALSH